MKSFLVSEQELSLMLIEAYKKGKEYGENQAYVEPSEDIRRRNNKLNELMPKADVTQITVADLLKKIAGFK